MDLLKLSITLLFGLVLKGIIEVDCFIDPASLAAYGAVIGAISYMLKDSSVREKAVKYTHMTLNKACQMIGFCEGCEDYWIPSNLAGLQYELESNVFGQSVANEIVLSALKGHLRNKQYQRSLLLSFQGSPGTGKNFVSQMILKNMFREGVRTKYVKFIRGSIDFPLGSNVNDYKKMLIKTIKDKVHECHRSVFVLDEVEKMPNGILDVLSGFINTGQEDEYDYRRVIFIILSNVGSESLTNYTLNAWKRGVKREDMSLRDLSKVLSTAAFNSAGGLSQSRLIRNHEISHFVPFLPLERQHIVQCLEKEVANRQQIMSEELVEMVLEELNFYPPSEQVFATSGCKGVAEATDRSIERELRRRRKSGEIQF